MPVGVESSCGTVLTGGLACLLFLLTATPAAAKTYNGRADAGPAIAGDSVLWGHENRNGSGYVMRDGKPIGGFPAPKGSRQRRVFGGVPGAIGASPTRVAYVLDDQTVSGHDDVVGIAVSVGVRVAVDGGPFTDPLRCTGAYMSTAVEGDTVALGVVSQSACAGIYVNGRKFAEAESTQVRLAGPYVAWVGYPNWQTITVAEVSTGTVLASFPGRWDAFDLDEQGNIVAIGRRGLVAWSLSDPRQRVLDRRPWDTVVATAAGRVAYIANRGRDRAALILADLDGRPLRRLERYGPRRWPVGEIALTDRRVAWSVRSGRNEDITAPGTVRTTRF
jgi:hypothetical protein